MRSPPSAAWPAILGSLSTLVAVAGLACELAISPVYHNGLMHVPILTRLFAGSLTVFGVGALMPWSVVVLCRGRLTGESRRTTRSWGILGLVAASMPLPVVIVAEKVVSFVYDVEFFMR